MNDYLIASAPVASPTLYYYMSSSQAAGATVVAGNALTVTSTGAIAPAFTANVTVPNDITVTTPVPQIVEGASTPENSHHVFTLSQQQGGAFFDASGKPTFDTPQNVAAVKQMIDFMQADKVTNPADAQYSKGTEALTDFATGKTSMVIWQASAGSLAKLGMSPADIGVAPVPLPSPLPAGGKSVTSMVAGINLAVFKDTKNMSAALKFVKFMTSTPEQETLNQTYGSLPTVSAAYTDPAFNTPAVTTFRSILSSTAAPMPEVPQESNFETTVGTAIIHLYADAATGKTVTSAMVAQALSLAQQQLGG